MRSAVPNLPEIESIRPQSTENKITLALSPPASSEQRVSASASDGELNYLRHACV